jgi:hypothetical protein
LAPGGQGTASLKLTSSNFYSGKVNATCDASALSGAMCVLSPANPINLASGGTAALTATVNAPSTASPGTYNINITTQDTTGAPSHSFTVALTVAQDFRLTSSTPSQTVTAGQTSGAYNLAVQPVGVSFTGTVTLACSAGIPAGAQCIFNPPTAVTPGTSAVDVMMNISTAARKAGLQSLSTRAFIFSALWLFSPGIVIAWGAAGRKTGRPMHRVFGSTAMLLLAALLISCGGVSSGGGTPPPKGNQPVTYLITVTGTSPGTASDAGQSVQVTLVVD